MTRIMNGGFTAEAGNSFVVFVVGMRVNRLLAVGKWAPTAWAMGPMLRELYSEPERDFLGAQTFLYWRGVAMMQYWRSFEDLERFARDREAPHLPAWRRFNRSVSSNGTVGIWHETYLIEPDNYEAIYANMPPFGLARATGRVPLGASRETARRRLGNRSLEEKLPLGRLYLLHALALGHRRVDRAIPFPGLDVVARPVGGDYHALIPSQYSGPADPISDPDLLDHPRLSSAAYAGDFL